MTKQEYLAPQVVLSEVQCESGFLGSTGDVEFKDAWDDGWEDL